MSTEMHLPDGIERLPITTWQNGHENFVHTFKENSSFKLIIPSFADQPYHGYYKKFSVAYPICN